MTDYTLEALQEQRQKLVEKIKVLDKKIAEKQRKQAERLAKQQAKKEQELGKMLLEDDSLQNVDIEKIRAMLAETIKLVKAEEELEKSKKQ